MPDRIIDALCYLPTEEVLLDLMLSTPPQMAGYANVFGGGSMGLLGLEGMNPDRMRADMSGAEIKRLLAPRLRPLALSLDDFADRLEAMGVERAVIFNMDEETPGRVKGLPNDYYAEAVARYPDRFIGMAGVDPLKGMDAVREIRRCHDLGLRGVSVRPFMFGLPPHHRKMYPIYAACVELDIPVWMHLSVNYSTLTMEVERPAHLDIVCQDFPELKVIAGHGGWPWINEMVAVAWRNPNVYFDISGYLPRYLARPGSGWEPLLHFGNTVLRDRVLFGSVWLLMGQSIRQLADEVRTLPLDEDVKEAWLYGNAARLFGIE
ncbi:MAG: amidohydrolase family protein [Proteobacteria bacterium]|nr:amidohydrolase family protein [Pseudomonadota bacterium]